MERPPGDQRPTPPTRSTPNEEQTASHLQALDLEETLWSMQWQVNIGVAMATGRSMLQVLTDPAPVSDATDVMSEVRDDTVSAAGGAAVAPPAHNDNEVLAQVDGRWRVLWSPTPLDLTGDLVRAGAAEAAHLAPPVEDGEWQVWRDDVTGQHYWLVVRHDAVGMMQTANG